MRTWVKVSRSAAGVMVATFTAQDSNLTASWSAKTYIGDVKSAIREARARTMIMLEAMQQEMSEGKGP